MVPLFAAVSAADTISKISDLNSAWKHKSSSSLTGTQQSKSPTSFASLLQSNGVDISKYLQKSVSTLTAGTTSSSGSAHSGSSVNQVA